MTDRPLAATVSQTSFAFIAAAVITETDIEIVQRFWRRSDPNGRRLHSEWSYRAWMLEHAQRIYKILLDGLILKNREEELRAALGENEALRANGELLKAGQTIASQERDAIADEALRFNIKQAERISELEKDKLKVREAIEKELNIQCVDMDGLDTRIGMRHRISERCGV